MRETITVKKANWFAVKYYVLIHFLTKPFVKMIAKEVVAETKRQNKVEMFIDFDAVMGIVNGGRSTSSKQFKTHSNV